MKRPTTGEIIYALKCFAASMLALYLALRIGLPRPFRAMMTAYVVASPLSGTVRSKAAYRFSGTIAVSLLDRTPRSYVFMLAGYTAVLIGFPVVNDPTTVFDVALARVEEIGIGILYASVVHSLVLPHSLGIGFARAPGPRHWRCAALDPRCRDWRQNRTWCARPAHAGGRYYPTWQTERGNRRRKAARNAARPGTGRPGGDQKV